LEKAIKERVKNLLNATVVDIDPLDDEFGKLDYEQEQAELDAEFGVIDLESLKDDD